ncbi:HTH-type transcriptional activator RhaS [compost metagenome]
MVIGAGARHTFATPRTNRFIVLDIPHATLSDQVFFPITPAVRHLLDYANHNAQALVDAPPLADSWSHLLLAALTTTPKPAESQQQLILARALAFIDQYLASPLTVSQIARACATSERRLYALFKQQLQRSPFAYITNLRLDKAVDMLRQSQRTIADIAQSVGYADQSALTHALKKARHTTPAAIRKSQV